MPVLGLCRGCLCGTPSGHGDGFDDREGEFGENTLGLQMYGRCGVCLSVRLNLRGLSRRVGVQSLVLCGETPPGKSARTIEGARRWTGAVPRTDVVLDFIVLIRPGRPLRKPGPSPT